MILTATYVPIATLGQSMNIASAVTASCDPDFYAANDILWYNECAAACSVDGSTSAYTDSSENAEAMFKYLTSAKFKELNGPMSALQAAAFLGNAYQESKYDPAAIQSGKSYNTDDAMNKDKGAYAFGLFQWDGGRRVALLNNVEKNKSSGTKLEQAWTDLTLQLRFLMSELDGSESAILKDNEFKTTTSVERATIRVREVFERAGSPNDAGRIKAANAAYDKYKSLAPSSLNPLVGGCNGTDASGGNGDIAQTAKDLSWEKRAESGAKDHTTLQDKPAYTKALAETGVNKLGDSCSKAGDSCDAFLATVLRYSGVDPKFPCCGADNQGAYLKKNSDKYTKVSDNATKTAGLEAGDILWHPGHVKIYIGDGKEAAASHCKRTGEQGTIYFDGSYSVFRAK